MFGLITKKGLKNALKSYDLKVKALLDQQKTQTIFNTKILLSKQHYIISEFATKEEFIKKLLEKITPENLALEIAWVIQRKELLDTDKIFDQVIKIVSEYILSHIEIIFDPDLKISETTNSTKT